MEAVRVRFDKQADSLFPNGGSDGGLELSGETDYCFLSRQTVVRTTEVLVTGGLCPKDSALLSFFVQHPTVSGLSSKKIDHDCEGFETCPPIFWLAPKFNYSSLDYGLTSYLLLMNRKEYS